MDEYYIKLECLKIAQELAEVDEVIDLIHSARQIYNFVTEKETPNE